jgi:hypothetical protein
LPNKRFIITIDDDEKDEDLETEIKFEIETPDGPVPIGYMIMILDDIIADLKSAENEEDDSLFNDIEEVTPTDSPIANSKVNKKDLN